MVARRSIAVGWMILCLTLLLFSGKHLEGKDKEIDYATVPDREVGLTPFKPVKDPVTGFIVGGKNATDLIRKLTQIQGRSIADLEQDMRPGAFRKGFEGSSAGFLGKKESLLEVLVKDNAFVVDKHGLTHQEVARPLLVAAQLGMKNAFNEKPTQFRYFGQQYEVTMRCFKGFQESPFLDNTRASCNAQVKNLSNKKILDYSLLVPQMIQRYGFYEGQGTSYRVEPAHVLELFPHLKNKDKKSS